MLVMTVMIVMIVEIPIIYREPLAIARVCANAHVSIIIISSSNNVINVSNVTRDTYYQGLRAGCLPDLHGLHATLALSPQGFFTKRSPHI